MRSVCGDLNPKNISIDPKTGFVVFLDTDSYHIHDGSKIYRCDVGIPAYLPAEVQVKMRGGGTLATAKLPTFTQDTDNFALAIHIFQLLMNGVHPFACAIIPSQSSVAAPQPSDNIVKGEFPFMVSIPGIKIPVYAPKVSILPKKIQYLFERAFVDGHFKPSIRPKPSEWHTALEALRNELKTCKSVSHHQYYKSLSTCPWCDANKTFAQSLQPNFTLTQKTIKAPIITPPPYVHAPVATTIARKRENWWQRFSMGAKVALISILIGVVLLSFGLYFGWPINVNNDSHTSKDVLSTIISAGPYYTVGLRSDGTVIATGSYYGYISDWNNITSISASENIFGLRSDGTAISMNWQNTDGQCDISDWRNIIAISAGDFHTVGLRSDGTVVAVGGEQGYTSVSYSVYERSDGSTVGSPTKVTESVTSWHDIIRVSAGFAYTVGLRSDGTVICDGGNAGSIKYEVAEWRNITEVSAGFHHIIGLRSDSTAVAVGNNEYGQCDVSNWKDVIAISAGRYHSVGLRSDGTVVAVGNNEYGQCSISNWTDIIAISAGWEHTVGLRTDGSVIAVGNNEHGQCDVSSWRDIKVQVNSLKARNTAITLGFSSLLLVFASDMFIAGSHQYSRYFQ